MSEKKSGYNRAFSFKIKNIALSGTCVALCKPVNIDLNGA